MSPKRERELPPIFGELRPSQIITTFGPGAVVDLPNVSAIIAGTNHWKVTKDQEIDEPRLKSHLRVQKLYRPATRTDGGIGGIPAFLFPRYLRCSWCHRLGEYDRSDLFFLEKKRFRCRGEHKGRSATSAPLAFPARFVTACSNGHLNDFPWFEYVHRGRHATGCRPELLTLKESARSAAVSDIVVKCERCGAFRTMEEAFGTRGANALGACRGGLPWLGEHVHEACQGGSVRTTLRGASNLYFASVRSALSIPEWDDPVHGALTAYEEQLTRIASVEDLQTGIRLGVFPRLERFDSARVFAALQQRREQVNRTPTMLDLRQEEYRALLNAAEGASDADRDFEVERADVPNAAAGQIGAVRIVRRLREVKVLNGFSRLDVPQDDLVEDDPEQDAVFKLQKLSMERLAWLPATELRGEGIFVALNENAVREWERSHAVQSRSRDLAEVHREWQRLRELRETPYPGARYVLLHSLAHMLIHALALDCGYSSTAIRERIYSSDDPNEPMAAILLYTATPDSDGSLGGLADKGRTERIGGLLADALERAQLCSSDPLCGHGAPGEMGTLNGAACHACLMVSETSCERGNRYLDRAHVVRTVALVGTEYFGD